MCNIVSFFIRGSQLVELGLLALSTVAGVVVLLFTAISVYYIFAERKEKLENKVKSSFLKNKVWGNEGVINGKDSVFFELCVGDPNIHIFSGEIKYFDAEPQEQRLTFYFKKINKKRITLSVHQTIGWRDVGWAQARLNFINPDLFKITFSKGYGFRKDRFMPDLPRKTHIFPHRVHVDVDIADEADIPQKDASRKMLTNYIIEALSPERNYAKVKELLGVPDRVMKDGTVFKDDNQYSIFSADELKKITSDIYFLDNAVLKVTTVDRQTIHSITVFGYDDQLEIPGIYYPCNRYNNTLAEARICQEIVDTATITSVRTIRDSATALRTSIGPPFYKYITYFTHGHLDDEENPDYNTLVGNEISGFCLSNSDLVFYIYDYELR